MNITLREVKMVDLQGQLARIRPEIDDAIDGVLSSCSFIGGEEVKLFGKELASYLRVDHVIPCANGTDALQIALMAIDLKPGDEVIVPAFTYAASAEAIALLGGIPVFVEVDPATFNVTLDTIARAVTSRTRAIIVVHLFGQSCEMEPIMEWATAHHLYVIEDAAQALGAQYALSESSKPRFVGTIGHIGCTSFFPTKNLACMGDGGALMTNDAELAEKLRRLASHGQSAKYHHDLIGCNSRLDALQAAILRVKLRHLPDYLATRYEVAARYDNGLSSFPMVILPLQNAHPECHTYNQYTLRLPQATPQKRDRFCAYLRAEGIPTMVYYPLPLHHQLAFWGCARAVDPTGRINGGLPIAESLCNEVVSLPMHTELTAEEQHYIIRKIIEYPFF